MTFYISGARKDEGFGILSQHATDISEALSKAGQMLRTGMIRISIEDGKQRVAGDDLIACIEGRKTLTSDLQIV